MWRFYEVLALALFAAGMIMLYLAMTGPRDFSAIAYVALWPGAVGAVILAGLFAKLAKPNQS